MELRIPTETAIHNILYLIKKKKTARKTSTKMADHAAWGSITQLQDWELRERLREAGQERYDEVH